ncbi:MAG: hypothetical protein K6G03_01700 [Lachnospiraceae bacterium]|nr:hypothetical protein [Lachnospiraceae bacterium]
MTIYEAMTGPSEIIDLDKAEGRTAAEQVVLYPPDIPVIIPGETIEKENIRKIRNALESGIQVIGMKKNTIKVVKK